MHSRTVFVSGPPSTSDVYMIGGSFLAHSLNGYGRGGGGGGVGGKGSADIHPDLELIEQTRTMSRVQCSQNSIIAQFTQGKI